MKENITMYAMGFVQFKEHPIDRRAKFSPERFISRLLVLGCPAGTGLGSITTVVKNFPRGRISRFRDVERALISAICDCRARI